MENYVSDILELKELIINSKEYKNYNKSLEEIKYDSNINYLVENIKKLQKTIVRTKDKKLEKELELYNNLLLANNKYRKYLNNAKKLNMLITKVQKKFNNYFDSLVTNNND